MRRSAPEETELIDLVERADLPVRITLRQLGIPSSTFYGWYKRYLEGGFDALRDKKPPPCPSWNQGPEKVRADVIDLALKKKALSTRELACHFTDERRYFLSESSVYRILKAADLITSPAYVLMSASDHFKHPSKRVRDMWQTKCCRRRSCVLSDFLWITQPMKAGTKVGQISLFEGPTPIRTDVLFSTKEVRPPAASKSFLGFDNLFTATAAALHSPNVCLIRRVGDRPGLEPGNSPFYLGLFEVLQTHLGRNHYYQALHRRHGLSEDGTSLYRDRSLQYSTTDGTLVDATTARVVNASVPISHQPYSRVNWSDYAKRLRLAKESSGRQRGTELKRLIVDFCQLHPNDLDVLPASGPGMYPDQPQLLQAPEQNKIDSNLSYHRINIIPARGNQNAFTTMPYLEQLTLKIHESSTSYEVIKTAWIKGYDQPEPRIVIADKVVLTTPIRVLMTLAHESEHAFHMLRYRFLYTSWRDASSRQSYEDWLKSKNTSRRFRVSKLDFDILESLSQPKGAKDSQIHIFAELRWLEGALFFGDFKTNMLAKNEFRELLAHPLRKICYVWYPGSGANQGEVENTVLRRVSSLAKQAPPAKVRLIREIVREIASTPSLSSEDFEKGAEIGRKLEDALSNR